ncbi:multiple C2 domain and transmembrane region protein 5-like [Silene latifolia]|uniref:multiple C2 domain and transmembrane region protein 5-like n=1 Tax=Silene latifolia TaxID=37657 RepID=UPI003D774C20
MNYKLGVEVTAAHDLIAKDTDGSSSAYVELNFDDQRFKTSIKDKDLNPVWNESFYFNISDPNNLSNLTLDACVFSYTRSTNSRNFLGKVHINGSSFVPYSEASEFYYPLEKRSVFSRVKGELGLKVFITDDPSVRLSDPPPVMEAFGRSDSTLVDEIQFGEVEPPRSSSRGRNGKRHTFFHLPKSDNNPNPNPNPNSNPNPQAQFFSTVTSAARAEAPAPKSVQGVVSKPGSDYKLRETSPFLGGGQIVGGRVMRTNKPVSTYDLVEQMMFLFVRVVKARDLPTMDVTGSLDPYVEVKVGNYKGVTKYFEKRSSPEWNEVFAFSRERIQSSVLEVVVKDKDLVKDDYVGNIRFDLNEVPTRVPPDSPLAPQWYRLEDRKGDKIENGELMLAVWYGTQADEAFSDAWHSDAITPPDISGASSSQIRSKVYHSPRLWYLRVNLIEAQDLIPFEKGRFPDVYIKAQLGFQILRTKPVQTRMGNPFWNEDLMFVAAEPFDEHLIITVEDRVGPSKEDTIGKLIIPLGVIRKRPDDKNFPTQWYNFQNPRTADIEEEKRVKFASKLHARISLDGGYHVLDESTYYASDLRPSMKQLWKSSIGVLELGILNADGILPQKTRDGRGTADTFCVAKYCQKWVRTRTIIDSLSPKYNEQYTWEVFDPSTVLTIGVFDNGHFGGTNKDTRIGKVRVRLSTLEAGRVYTHAYPLLVLQPSGVKKMGELHLAVRFSCTNVTNLMYLYSKPLLPKMHYTKPLSLMQTNLLRNHAINVLASRLNRAEPPLKKEVVDYMCDVDAHFWSMRRSKANFYRIVSLLQGFLAAGKWFTGVCAWKNSVTTILVHLLFIMLVCFPELVLPTVFLYMFLIGLWNYRFRARHPPHMDTRISYADIAVADELDEEFDSFPTSKGASVVRMRYDRLRSIGAKVQSVLGDIAAQGERAQALLSWRDPRASTLFLTFCLVAAVVLYVTPLQVMALFGGFYTMRHPKFRHKLPSAPINFFRRLPSKTDCLL